MYSHTHKVLYLINRASVSDSAKINVRPRQYSVETESWQRCFEAQARPRQHRNCLEGSHCLKDYCIATKRTRTKIGEQDFIIPEDQQSTL